MAYLWTEKHRPTKVEDFVDNYKAVHRLKKWLALWQKGKPKKKAVFLYGPPGIGKTTIVEILAKENNFDLLSWGASNWRTKEILERVIGVASVQRPLYGSDRLIVLDEMEGISGSQERRSISKIINIIKKNNYPIVLIANDVWNPRFSSLRNSCVVIKFNGIPVKNIITYLLKICQLERIRVKEKAIRFIAEKAKGDLRSAINDLQALSQNKTLLTYDDVRWIAPRDKKRDIFNVLSALFTSNNCWDARRVVDEADVNYDMLFEWIYENLPYQLSNIHELSDALEAISRADIFFKRVKQFQEWRLLKYAFDQMTAGVAMARRKPYGFSPFKFPERIKVMARTKKERRLRYKVGRKIKNSLHMSSMDVVKEVLPYLRIIFKNDFEFASKMINDFELDTKTIQYLTKS